MSSSSEQQQVAAAAAASLGDDFPCIYHERQVGALCGQHCLNNLLGSQKVGLSRLVSIAQELDAAERRLLGSVGDGKSHNVDESGNFSLGVLQKALQPFGLTLLRVGSVSTSTEVPPIAG